MQQGMGNQVELLKECRSWPLILILRIDDDDDFRRGTGCVKLAIGPY